MQTRPLPRSPLCSPLAGCIGDGDDQCFGGFRRRDVNVEFGGQYTSPRTFTVLRPARCQRGCRGSHRPLRRPMGCLRSAQGGLGVQSDLSIEAGAMRLMGSPIDSGPATSGLPRCDARRP